MDARFILVEIGKLTASVERLISDVGSITIDVGELRRNLAFLKGAFYVLGGLVVVCSTVVGLIASGKLKVTLG